MQAAIRWEQKFRSLLDTFCVGMFWVLVGLVGFVIVWEFLDYLRFRHEPEEPDEWSKLSDEEKSELKRFFK
jgi:hypothetical protein